MAVTRRDMLRGLVSPSYWEEKDRARRLPPDRDIHLDRDACLAWGRGICVRCEGACPEGAILFVGMMNPRLLDARCTLCGDCVPACPVDAILLRPDAARRAKEGT